MKTYILTGFLNLMMICHIFGSSTFEVPASLTTNSNHTLRKFEVMTDIDRTLTDLASRELFSGTVLISRNNETLFKKAYGYSNFRTMSPNTTETKFNLGSINKIFTNVAILQLAEQGRLNLDDKLIKHLPALSMNGISNIVTIRQLLEMTSGLGDVQTNELSGVLKNQYKELDDYVSILSQSELSFTPGSGTQYSNAGYILLGLVIEEITGSTYHNYVKENIFFPVGMQNTDFYTLDQKIPNLAIGCTGVKDNWKKCESNINMLPYKGNSAEGGYSTVDDMALFFQALNKGKLISPKYVNYIFTQQIGANESAPIHEGQLTMQGGAPGVNCCLSYNAKTDELIIVLGNYDPPVATNAFRKIKDKIQNMELDKTI